MAQTAPAIAPEFVQLPLAPAQSASRDIWIEMLHGNAAIKVDWPLQASGDCAAWLGDWRRDPGSVTVHDWGSPR